MNDPNEFPAYDEPLNTGSATGAGAPTSLVPPPVLKWYKIYAGFMIFLYALCMIGGFMLLNYLPTVTASAPEISATELKVRAVILIVIGVVLFVAYAVALVLPKSPGAWVYHLVMIGIGLSSCCLWPATIPMMIAWLKPETQRWFGRAGTGVLPVPRDPNLPPPPIPPA
jgi:MFS family permease